MHSHRMNAKVMVLSSDDQLLSELGKVKCKKRGQDFLSSCTTERTVGEDDGAMDFV